MDAEEKLLLNGFDDVKYFTNFSYDDALVGVTTDGQAVYDYNLMIDWLIKTNGWSEDDAIDWVNYNTIRGLSYMGEGAPIIMFPLFD